MSNDADDARSGNEPFSQREEDDDKDRVSPRAFEKRGKSACTTKFVFQFLTRLLSSERNKNNMYNFYFYFKKITLILIYPYFVFFFELDATTEVGVGLLGFQSIKKN